MASSKDPTFGSQKRYKIGYAVSSKKQQTFITPSLISVASSHCLDLIPIDPSLPISSQFQHLDLILHKLYDDLWISNLNDFSAQNLSVPIVDPPELIKRVQDRISMLQFVSQLKIQSNRELISDQEVENKNLYTFGVPKQVIILNAAALADSALISDLNYPLIAKPLASDGSSASHRMGLVFSYEGFLKQSPPLVLQEFVNHGGVVFKVYVAGDYVKCVERKSLPDLSSETLTAFAQFGSVPFSQISNTTIAQDGTALKQEAVEMPPECFVMELARGLRSAMGLNLFNFDMIRDGRIGNHYLVIDINYFPGYEKLPDYETVMTDFLCSIVHKEQENASHSASGDDDENSEDMVKR